MMVNTTLDDRSGDGGALRRDVSFLGALLGEVLREQGGDELFDTVEAARLAARARRDGDKDSDRRLDNLLSGLEPRQAAEVARAFSAYFALVNMAERVQRIRRHFDYIESGTPQPGSLEDVVLRLAADGLGVESVRELVGRMLVKPVFTAHPTEAIRRTILAKEQRVAHLLIDRLEHSGMSDSEEVALTRRLRDEITLMWQTAEHPGVRRSVTDEVEHVLFYLTDVVYDIVPALNEAMASALRAAYGGDAGDDLPCPFVRFGSWVGGDMDGNPNVGPDTINHTLERQRELILNAYVAEVRDLFRHLSQSRSRITVDETVDKRCREYQGRMPEVAATIPSRYDDMPYRILLWFCWARLEDTRDGGSHAYPSAAAFGTDLELIAASLRHNRGAHAGLTATTRLVRRVQTFGFHLATLDVRQDALVHRSAAGELMADPGFVDRSPEERARQLRRAIDAGQGNGGETGAETATTLEVFASIANARANYGPEAVGPYIISMAQGPDDALGVLFLARRSGLTDEHGNVPVDVTPLFETVADLDHAGTTLARLLADPLYRNHVAARADRQIVMLGYSDSSKQSCLTASRWALYRAETALSATADDAGVELTLFHGRGGTAGRGGSKPRDGILAEPPGVVRGRLRVTEQGEIIHAKYGLHGIALRTLELMTGAVLEASAVGALRDEPRPGWAAAMETAAAAGEAAYRNLVYDDPDFHDYFRLATPIDIIEGLEIGSRPATRRAGAGVEDLRAIPWVFAWIQNRHLLPGWFGVGSGLAAATEAHGEAVLREMAREWPFFANLLADVEMVLAKSDLGIGARYARLAGTAGERLVPMIMAEYERTCRIICDLLETGDALEHEPVLRRSIRLRNPYVDPISLLQVDLLERWRAGDSTDADLERALRSTVRGIARGMQNTG
jgi:phosphoenolpyruvate carboxylase